jgi:hypothetical protein
LLFLIKKLGLHLVPLFLKFLGIRLPPGLKSQQVILVLEPQGLLGIRVLPGKLKRSAGQGLGLPLSQKTLVASCSACFRARFFFNAAFTWSLIWARGGRCAA